jgi:hypothetical protein
LTADSALLAEYDIYTTDKMKSINVNAHLHTPYSFSAFDKLTDALDQAVEENVQVVGINDFYTTDGYEEWEREALKRHLFPLFNIEFICLQEEDRDNGIRVNDPNNPGRTYISGKGLRYPSALAEPFASQLAGVRAESEVQTKKMCAKLNDLLSKFNAEFNVDYDMLKVYLARRLVRNKYNLGYEVDPALLEKYLTKILIRERHLAKGLRMSAYVHFKNDPDRIKSFLEKLFNGKSLKSNIHDYAGVENEIRGNLLKAGGDAFVPEDPKAFLPLESVRQIIFAAGGIPTYPFLGDNAKGEFMDFEQDMEKAALTLKQRGIYSAEFITTRNSIEMLEKYSNYLYYNEGFIVTFGTEHNTPAMEPVLLSACNKTPLTESLKDINYKSTCVIAAHQDRVRKGKEGYTVGANREAFINEGDELIRKAIDE